MSPLGYAATKGQNRLYTEDESPTCPKCGKPLGKKAICCGWSFTEVTDDNVHSFNMADLFKVAVVPDRKGGVAARRTRSTRKTRKPKGTRLQKRS